MRNVKPIARTFFVPDAALLFRGSGWRNQSAQLNTLEKGQTQMRVVLAAANPTVRSNLYNRVEVGIRFGNYEAALAALNEISGDPSLDAKQKKVVDEVAALLKSKLQNPVKP
jgi:hypothetical protein